MSVIDDIVIAARNKAVQERNASASYQTEQEQNASRQRMQSDLANRSFQFEDPASIRWINDPVTGQRVPDRRPMTTAEREEWDNRMWLTKELEAQELTKAGPRASKPRTSIEYVRASDYTK
jgi:hypothetical protein